MPISLPLKKAVLSPLFYVALLVSSLGAASAAPGDLDPTFGNGGQLNLPVRTQAFAYAVAQQSDGKLIVGGQSRTNSSLYDFTLVRLMPNGNVDTSFGTNGFVFVNANPVSGIKDEVHAIVIQPDGKIVASGSVRSSSGALVKSAALRFLPDGTRDATFGTNGMALMDAAVDRALVLQPDGKFVLGGGGGSSQQANFQFFRLNANGTPDATFGTNGKVVIDFDGSGDGVWGLALQPDGKIIGAGQSRLLGDDDNFAVARLNPDGSLDTTFGTGGKVTTDLSGQTDIGYGVTLQPDGKIVVVGQARTDVNEFNFGVVRYNPDGSLDTTFSDDGMTTTGLGLADSAFAVRIQENNKIVVAGVAGGVATDFGLVRYLPDGTLDTTFGDGGKVRTFFEVTDQARALLIQPDGKIVAAGIADGGAIIGHFAVARFIGDPIQGAVMSGQINVQSSANIAGENVSFILRQSSGDLLTRTVTVGANGNVELSGIPRDVLMIQIKARKWLSVRFLADTRSGSLTLPPLVLKAGDVNDDNAVDYLDLLALMRAFNSARSAPAYFEVADFNANGTVDIADLLLLLENYNQVGA